jgi:hypothetical protein
MNLQGDSMKKSLIALAVAGAFAAPSAMAVEFTPTMYESLAFSFNGSDLNGVTQPSDGNSVRSGGGSTIGFKFTDDLGNGMTAEAFVHITTNIPLGNASTFSGRNGYVGLTGNFGAFKLGANEHVYEVGQIIDGWGADWFGGNSVGFWTGSPTRLGISGWNFTRQDLGSLWWTSPSWGGFVLDAVWITGPGGAAIGANTIDAEGVQLAAKWSNANWLVSGAWADYSDYALGAGSTQFGGGFQGDVSGTATQQQDAQGLRFTVQWSTGWGNVGGSVNFMESENKVSATNSKNEVTTYALTGTLNLASGRVILNYVQADDQDFGGAKVNDSGAMGWDIGYQHDLSASTYAFVRYEANEGDVNYDPTAGGKTETDALMIGMKISY